MTEIQKMTICILYCLKPPNATRGLVEL